jgi:DNA polymerase-1
MTHHSAPFPGAKLTLGLTAAGIPEESIGEGPLVDPCPLPLAAPEPSHRARLFPTLEPCARKFTKADVDSSERLIEACFAELGKTTWADAADKAFDYLTKGGRQIELLPGATNLGMQEALLDSFVGFNAFQAEQVVEVITDAPGLARMLADLGGQAFVGIDTETEGLMPWGANRLVTCQIATETMTYVVVWPIADPAAFRAWLETEATKVFHNAVFDIMFLESEFPGVRMGGIADTMIAGALLNAGLASPKLKLEDLAQADLQRTLKKTAVRTSFRQGLELTQEQIAYAAVDAYTTRDLWPIYRRRLVEAGLWKVASLEFLTAQATARMELKGILVDKVELAEVEAKFLARMELLATEARLALAPPVGASTTLFEVELNLGSPDQVLERFRSLGVRLSGTSKDVLANVEHPAAMPLIKWRSLSSYTNTTITGLRDAIHPLSGRVHTRWGQVFTPTGRFTASRPAIQGTPAHGEGKVLRYCVKPPEGRLFINADYSQIELRIAAVLTRDRVMLDAFNQGVDIHSLTASRIGRKQLETVTPEERQKAKAINFGLLYGMGAETLQAYARTAYHVEMSIREATEAKEAFLDLYRGIALWHEETKALCNRKLPTYQTRTFSGRRRLFTAPWLTAMLNSQVQGTGADILKLAMCYLDEYDWLDLVAVVHDETLIEVDADRAAEGLAAVNSEMVSAGEAFLKGVPVVVDAAVVPCWKGTPIAFPTHA